MINLIIFGISVSGLYAQSDSCHLKFKVNGFTGGKIKLIGVYADQNYIADSTFMNESGEFEFRRKSPFKPGYFYVILPDYSSFHIMINDEQFFTMESNKGEYINTMKISGSIDNELLYQSMILQSMHEKKFDSLNSQKSKYAGNQDELKRIEKELDLINNERKEYIKNLEQKYPNVFFTKFKIAGQNPEVPDFRKPNGEPDISRKLEFFRLNFWNDVDLMDNRLLATPVIVNKLNRFITDLTVQHPDSIIRQADFVIQKSLENPEMFQFFTNYIALKYQPSKTKVMDGEAVYVHIIDKYFTKDRAFWLTEKELADLRKKAWEMSASLLNKVGPDVVSVDPNGQTKSIYGIKKPYIIVFMYDPKCEHCQEETPKLKQFYEEWKNKGVEVFAIVLNAKDQEWRDFIKKYQIQNWINVHDPTNASIYAKYYVDITPEMYVLNKDRKIIGKNLKVEQLKIILDRDMGITN
ncbi:MAG: redoxin domain-containing protein [Saprospiraceae bacterium]|nr:redoxin domain-containing protein [Candidatus Vicinibacter affinis]MBP6521567.1 redoxin domain-containing protein [Saprospiraceae bacterium]MBK7302116.1 redoxin domain-containing protein [Candidatus Vicinibacter affinis]MBK7693257.1 redoxin domain-containing protein [Candidatus Vicinibacter affinis]MBK8403000.1 redoxin domain-containing protein [Candidatus Vicinibacter affinis]